jgi:competence protein ComEA
MRTELPAERLQRRLNADPDTDAHAEPEGASSAATDDPRDDDQNSLLPRWLPDASQDRGWVARVRADPGRAGAIGLAIVAVLAVLVTVFTLLRDRPAPVMSAKLPPVAKVSTAGPRSSASPGAAQPPSPDRPVVVSVVGLVHAPGLVGSSVATGTAPTSKAPPPAPGSVKPKPGQAVDLNTATVQELDALPGVGPVTAAAIVAWRQSNGKFTSVDQLAEVEGIGPARLEKLRALVRV